MLWALFPSYSIDFTEWQKVQKASIKEYFDKAFDTYGKIFMTNGKVTKYLSTRDYCQSFALILASIEFSISSERL